MWTRANIEHDGKKLAGSFVETSKSEVVSVQLPVSFEIGSSVFVDDIEHVVTSCKDISGCGDIFVCQVEPKQTSQKPIKKDKEAPIVEEKTS